MSTFEEGQGYRAQSRTAFLAGRFFIYAALTLWAVVCLFPVYWTVTTSFKTAPNVMQGHIVPWLQFSPDWRGWRSLALSPLVFAGVLLSKPTDPGGLFEDGVGGGAIAIPLFAMAGGFALSGRGSRSARLVAGLVALAPIPLWALTATSVGGAGLALDTARGAWVALYFWTFLALLALACAIPHRPLDRFEPTPTRGSRDAKTRLTERVSA